MESREKRREEKRRDPLVIQVEPHKLLTKFRWATANELCCAELSCAELIDCSR